MLPPRPIFPSVLCISCCRSQEPFEHDAKLVDRQDKRLTQAEKRLAKRSYELEKKAANTATRPNFYPRGHPGAYRSADNGNGEGALFLRVVERVQPHHITAMQNVFHLDPPYPTIHPTAHYIVQCAVRCTTVLYGESENWRSGVSCLRVLVSQNIFLII